MSKITLSNVGSLTQNPVTAQATINSNFTTIQTAFDNTLSRDGTSPNQMAANLDMNSNRILNLPNAITSSEPLRLQDLSTFVGGGTVTNIPAGGSTNAVLQKNSATNYDVSWTNNIVANTLNVGGSTISRPVAIRTGINENLTFFDTGGGVMSMVVSNDANTINTPLTIAANPLTFGFSPLAPTPTVGDISTKVATTAFVAITPPGTGGVTSTPGTKLNKLPFVDDWSTPTQAFAQVNSTGGGVLRVEGGVTAPTLPAALGNTIVEYDGPAVAANFIAPTTTTALAKKLWRAQDAGSHANFQHHAALIEYNPVGSGTNGPLSTDGTLMLNVEKQNWLTGATAGQIDGLMVYLRQGGPPTVGGVANQSDCAALECDVRMLQQSGFAAVMEGVTVVQNAAGTQLRGIDVQIAAINSLTSGDNANGMLCQSVFAPCGVAFLAQEDNTQGPSSWNYGFYFTRSDGVNTSNIDRNGNYLGQSYKFTDGTGIDAAAWTTFTPSVVITGGTGTATCRYKRIGKVVHIQMSITCTAAGTFTSATLPVSATATTYTFAGREQVRTGTGWIGFTNGSTVSATTVSNTGAMSLNDNLVIAGTYESV